MRKLKLIIISALIVVSMAFPAMADTFVSNGNGGTVYYDDGSRIEYNARGSSVKFYSVYGDLIYEEYADYTESEFRNRYYHGANSGSSSRLSSSSSKNDKYSGSEITSAKWSYSNGSITAKWDADHRSKASYTVTLYRDDRKVTSKTSSGGSSVNFTDAIANSNRTGDYYFHVKAKWPGGYTDEYMSDYYWIDNNKLNAIRNHHNGSSNNTSYSNNYNQGGPSGPGGGPGIQAQTWQQVNGIWKYIKADGRYAANGWEFINGKWYYFDANANMAANQWILSAVNPHIWYYVGPNGDMLVNQYVGQWWVNENGECYY